MNSALIHFPPSFNSLPHHPPFPAGKRKSYLVQALAPLPVGVVEARVLTLHQAAGKRELRSGAPSLTPPPLIQFPPSPLFLWLDAIDTWWRRWRHSPSGWSRRGTSRSTRRRAKTNSSEVTRPACCSTPSSQVKMLRGGGGERGGVGYRSVERGLPPRAGRGESKLLGGDAAGLGSQVTMLGGAGEGGGGGRRALWGHSLEGVGRQAE